MRQCENSRLKTIIENFKLFVNRCIQRQKKCTRRVVQTDRLGMSWKYLLLDQHFTVVFLLADGRNSFISSLSDVETFSTSTSSLKVCITILV